MKINEVLDDFVKECSAKLNLMSIIQFGSSTYSRNPEDIDLVFFSNEDIFSAKDYIVLFKIINDFENKYPGLVFYIAGGLASRKGKYKISVIPQQKLDLVLLTDPFFIGNLYKDKDKKILFGKNPYIKPVILDKNKIISTIILEINFALRRCLDKNTLNESVTFLFKSILRLMLVNVDPSRKGKLLDNFRSIYPRLSLPENSKLILENKVGDKDLEKVLEFANKCIMYLNEK